MKRLLLFSSLIALSLASSSSNNNYKCNYLTAGILPSGVCYSTALGSAKYTCDPATPNKVKLLTSGSRDCPAGSSERTWDINMLNLLAYPGYCGGSDCYTSFSAYTSNDCSGSSFSAGLYAGGEHCQSGFRYYCDARGFYIYLHIDTITCLANWGRIVIHDTGCQTTDLRSYGIPSYIKSFRFGGCKSANPPPGSFQLQINYHTQAMCAGGSEAVAFEFPLLEVGCFLHKYEFFCAADGFYKYEYNTTSANPCAANLVEVGHVPSGCLTDFTETLITGINFGSVSFQCLPGGPDPKPIAFGASVEASNVKVFADSQCSVSQEIRQVYATTGACRPMTELETSNVFPTTASAAIATGYYKIMCTGSGFQIDARYTSNQCTGNPLETKTGALGACVAVQTQNGAGVIYMTVLQCQRNLQVSTPQRVTATNGGVLPTAVFVWGVVLAGLVSV